MIIEVTEASQAGEARRKATTFAEELRMSETRCGEVALVTAELATNLVKHAGRGYILVQPLEEEDNGLRILSVDKGIGIADIGKALSDGHSTAGSMGSGLGAIKRVPDAFDLYSVPGAGTVVCAEFRSPKHPSLNHSAMDVGVLSEPIAGEKVCGDGWSVWKSTYEMVFMVVDGLGHGILASEAAREAERIFAASKKDSLQNLVSDIHNGLKKTRGAALGMAKIELEQGLLRFVGVGNVAASIVSPGMSRSVASHNGTVGQVMEKLQEFTVPWNPGSMLIMHSDGLMSRWSLEGYPGIWNRPASVIAALLHRDYSRGRDDVTVLVAKSKTER